MLFLYDLFLSLYALAIRVVALFNPKAEKWISGRRDWQQKINEALRPGEQRIWIHCSSVGEFEQAKPLIEAIKQQYSAYRIVVTFFSPSGYEACKKSTLPDYVFYLPHDSKRNAGEFIRIVQPAMAAFVKYEFWYHYLIALKRQNIPTLLVSGSFRKDQVFFKWYGGLFRKMLGCFTFFFLQDEDSKQVLQTIGISSNVVVSGDTRYDRVAKIAANVTSILLVEKFKGDNHILIAGSTWPGDEDVLKECLSVLPANWKLIIAPHEVDEPHVQKVQQLFGTDAILFSSLDAENTCADKRILIINNIGMLSRLFAYGDVAFIGGGFQKGGIHNILEPAIFGLPVVFGPVYEKFVEAKELAALKYVFPVNDAQECKDILKKLVSQEDYRKGISASLQGFMQVHVGATGVIMSEVGKSGWLK